MNLMNVKNNSGVNKRYVIGDIHGAHIPLKQCLERSGFDYENDLLITLGDICDGWPYVDECVEELLKIRHRIDIIGNHDRWFTYWLETGIHPDNWRQGGRGTLKSYLKYKDSDKLIVESMYHDGYMTSLTPDNIPENHKHFFTHQTPFHLDGKKRLFVHGGFYRYQDLKTTLNTNPHTFWWDRNLWEEALSVQQGQKLKFKEDFNEIFIGHTATIYWDTKEEITEGGIIIPKGSPITTPMHADIIWNIDTGAGSTGKLTIMDIDTHEYWQSDKVNTIYGDYKPRG